MQPENIDSSLEALHEIRDIMDRSARFISLSGWSGIWAGTTALGGAYYADHALMAVGYGIHRPWLVLGALPSAYDLTGLIPLALVVFIVALAGGLFFTIRKARRQGVPVWNRASRQLLLHLFLPVIAGGIYCAFLIRAGHVLSVAPACLIFYGLGLISASKYTLSTIRYLGFLEVALGCTNLFFPDYSLYFWAVGFGILHILYGLFMWNKYDK